MSLDNCIIQKCQESWDEQFIPGTPNYKNCSGFVKSVAKKLNIPLPNVQADGIVSEVEKTWTKIKTGSEASKKAAMGFFVIAGLKSGDYQSQTNQGHVAIVINGPLYRDKYPLCWGRSTGNAQSKGNKSVGLVWRTDDRDNVAYYMYNKQVCTT